MLAWSIKVLLAAPWSEMAAEPTLPPPSVVTQTFLIVTLGFWTVIVPVTLTLEIVWSSRLVVIEPERGRSRHGDLAPAVPAAGSG